MGRSRTTPRDTEADKTQRVHQILDEVIRRQEAGESVDEADLERTYAELLPQLHDQLDKLKAIQAAADQAARRGPLFDGAGGADALLKDEQRLLEDAFEGYRILERVEYGGQGVIYRAIQTATKQPVAIKVLLDGPLASDRQRLRFEREVDLVSRLRHPNIVALYDSGVVRGRPYFAMEFVEGVPIDDYLLFRRPPVRECVELFAGVCRAVGHAHQHGVIHRDLKPGNILVDVEGQPHILDFGLAKAFDDRADASTGAGLTVPGGVFGTLPYLSPEQIDEADGEADVRTDVYALGVVLYRLLTGAFPYPVEGKPTDVCQNILTCEPASLRRTFTACPPEDRLTTGEISDDLERIVHKALAKDKARRYESATALAADLDRYLAGEAVHAKADSSLYVLRKIIKRSRVPAAFSAVLLLVILASSVVITLQLFKTRQEQQNVVNVAGIGQETLNDIIELVIDSRQYQTDASGIQDKILMIARRRFEELMPLLESDRGLDPIRASIHEGLGDIAYSEGRYADAFEHYETLLGINRRLPAGETAQTERDLATLRAYRKAARVAQDRDTWYDRALQFGEDLLARHPNNPQVTEQLCETHTAYAWHLFNKGHYAASAEQSKAAAWLAEQSWERNPEEQKWTVVRARAHEWQGATQAKLGNMEKAIAFLRSSLDLRRDLVEANPSDAALRHEMSLSYTKLGTAYRDAGRLSEALHLLNRAVEIGERLAKAAPSDATAKRDLFGTHTRLAKLHLMTNDLSKAEEHSEAAFTLAQGLIVLEPQNMLWRRLHAAAHAFRGQVRFKQKDLKGAHEDFRTALEIRQRLVACSPSNASLIIELAEAREWLGSCCVELDWIEEAFMHYREAHTIRESFPIREPAGIEFVEGRVTSKINLALGHLLRNTVADDEAAARLLDEARSTVEELMARADPTPRRQEYGAWLARIKKNTRVVETRRARRTGNSRDDPTLMSPGATSEKPGDVGAGV